MNTEREVKTTGLLLPILGLTLVYIATGWVGLLLSLQPGNVSPVFPPAGVGLAAILLFGRRVAPGVWLGSFLLNMLFFYDPSKTCVGDVATSCLVSAGFGAGSSLQALVGATLLHRWVGARSPFDRAVDVFKFSGVAMGMCLVASTVGSTTLLAAGVIPSSAYAVMWWTWWMGDMVGVLVITPLVLSWRSRAWRDWSLRRVDEFALLIILLSGVSLVAFGLSPLGPDPRGYPVAHLTLPLLVWAAFRLGQFGAAVTILILSAIAVWGTAKGLGPFASESVNTSLLLLQVFVAALAVTTLALAAITGEQKKTEMALRERDHLYRRAIVQANGTPYQKDYRANVFTFMGEGIRALTGYSPEEMTPELMDAITAESSMRGPAAGLSLEEANRRARAGEILEWQAERCIQTRYGGFRWLADSGIQILDDQGTPVGSIGFLQDITAHKQSEKKLRESNRQLEETLAELKAMQRQIIQQERLRALGQMASGIAHDFNNYLTPILGFSDMLLKHPANLDDKAKTTRYLQMVNTAANDAANVILHLQEFYRRREENSISLPVNLNELVKQSVELTRPRWKDEAQARNIAVTVEEDLQDIPVIAGEAAELREMLTNLILNAVDAMPSGGTITLRTRFNGELIRLEVSDTGVGMTEEVRQRCLEPFFSTKGVRGTGLGLAIVLGVVQRHRGEIDIESEPGRGTTICILLPILPPTDIQTAGVETRLKPGRSLHVLVVDDEPLVRQMLTEFLTIHGHTFEIATNGREGLETFSAARFDLVITDRAMPQMNGDRLAAFIKQVSPATPIIMLTGFGNMMTDAGEHPAGVDAIVSKPITLTELQKVLAKVTKNQLTSEK